MKITDYNLCVDQYADSVYRFIFKNMKVEAWSHDVVQDAFMKMWEKRKNIEASKAKSYLFTTAYHCMIDVLRREKKVVYREELPTVVETGVPPSHDLQTILHQALDQLSEIQKSVVLLRDYEGYNYDEIGEICGLNPSQVKVYIYRARLSMKKYIGKPELVI
ncbi:MAG: sigma-70 family RNA polymerase sigma factor [Bacteroidales bacterium]|nr:sigma-70 family RNA polymerase sigma factor [Bacteroidales bacterium]